MNDRPLKLLVDVPVDPAAACRVAISRHVARSTASTRRAEEARRIDPARLRDADVLFCTFPPTNFDDLNALRWIQIASTGYTQLFGLDLPAARRLRDERPRLFRRARSPSGTSR